MNRVKVGFFSLSELSDPEGYLEWHQLDHMPEQYRIAGLVFGQRFVVTPACRAASAVRVGDIGRSESLQLYLMEDPPRVLPEFYALGRELAGLGRLRTDITAHVSAAFQLLGTYASPRALISPEAVPYRPNRGVYVLVEQVTDPGGLDDWTTREHRERVPAVLDVAGVVGLWTFASTGAWGIPASDLRIALFHVDEDPVAVAKALLPHLEQRWDGAPVRPLLAAPFASLFPPPASWDHLGGAR